jgi:hypothetical protein
MEVGFKVWFRDVYRGFYFLLATGAEHSVLIRQHFSPDCYTSRHQALKPTSIHRAESYQIDSEDTSDTIGTYKIPEDGIDDAETCRSKLLRE